MRKKQVAHEIDNLTAKQLDYAVFLPALSGFYATYVGKQRFPDPVKGLYVDANRMPADFENGMQDLTGLIRMQHIFPIIGAYIQQDMLN